MNIVVFGLTISSSWGNGHATLWRGLVRALKRQGCRVAFFERDVPYYAANRDFKEISGGELVLYASWEDIAARARREIAQADAAIVTSYCPDAIAATDLIASAKPRVSVFYDLDTPVTLAQLSQGAPVGYIGSRKLRDFDLVLSFTGGAALDELRHRLCARRVEALYGHVDPDLHRPTEPVSRYAADLSYLGTYSADRQPALQALFVIPASQRPKQRFLIGGAQYPHDFPWHPNIVFVGHLPPSEHPAFFSSSRLTLNVTRTAMARMGWCPSGRLFEAAACGVAVVTDDWNGLSSFYTEGQEILVVRSTEDVVSALELSDAELRRIAVAARERTLAEHTSEHRATILLNALEQARRSPLQETLAIGQV
jgi:spore maturation protein CgeB